MAYHIYQTEGLVLRSLPDGESSRYIEVFTRELGLVGANARSVREERSKLRYALQDYASAKVSLVRGKRGWKVVNAAPEENYYGQLKNDPRRLSSFVRIVGLVRKLVAGEDRNEPLYDALMGSIRFLASDSDGSEDAVSVQIVAALRILRHLGYGVGHPDLERLAGESYWNADTIARARAHRVEAERLIRASLSTTHL